MDKQRLVKVYLHRLVGSLLREDFGAEYTQSLVNELLQDLFNSPSAPSTKSAESALNTVKSLLLASGQSDTWIALESLVSQLSQFKSPEQISRYIIFLLDLLPQQPSYKRTKLSPEKLQFPDDISGSRDVTVGSMFQIASSHTNNNATEQTIVESLRNTLLGVDSEIFSFDANSIAISTKLCITHTDAAFRLCELALIYKRLLGGVSSAANDSLPSPVKTAFIRCLERRLSSYVADVNAVFHNSPSSLLTLLQALFPQFHKLRLLLHLFLRLESLDGLLLLGEVYTMANSGDEDILVVANGIFSEMVSPYYEYIEHWILKGSLLDENNEFFVSFDEHQQHINDIVQFAPDRCPAFLKLDVSVCEKMYQIGKTIIFLEKFCNDLDWVSSYFHRYSSYVFQSHKGVQSMTISTLHKLVINQYDELITHLNTLVFTKYDLFEHLVNLKDIMLLSGQEFFDTINTKGEMLFKEPAMSLTSGLLTELLSGSIDTSTVKFMPEKFKNRIDARILDLSHGNIAWEVFTLEYRVPESALQSLLNHNNQLTGYLRLFNFLWSIKHFQHVLQSNYKLFAGLGRNYLVRFKDKKLETWDVGWIYKRMKTINLMRSHLVRFLGVLLKYVSADLIEDHFRRVVTEKLFKSGEDNNMGVGVMAILNKGFAKKLYEKNELFGLKNGLEISVNVNGHTIDGLVSVHDEFLNKIVEHKLLNEKYYGATSGNTLVQQVYEFLDIIFAFVSSSEEFASLVVNYANLMALEEVSGTFEEDVERLNVRMNGLMRVLREIFTERFLIKKSVFIRDLRGDIDLKELSRMF